MSIDETNGLRDQPEEMAACGKISACGMFLLGFLVVVVPLGSFVLRLPQTSIPSNESNAIGSLRAITGAQVLYNAATGHYATSFAELQASNNGSKPFLDGDWSPPQHGYVFELSDKPEAKECFELRAVPLIPGRTGKREFSTDCSGVIRFGLPSQ
jgi:hypothetical protein